MSVEAIITLIIAVAGAGVSLLSWRASSAKDLSEALKQAVATCKDLQDQMDDERAKRRKQGQKLIELAAEIAELKKENAVLRDGINRLLGQLMSMGHEPVWKPEEEPTRKDAV